MRSATPARSVAILLGALALLTASRASPEPVDERCIHRNPAVAQGDTYVIGAWNLQTFSHNLPRVYEDREFPERSQTDYDYIAQRIRDLDVKILLIEEVYTRGRGPLLDVSSRTDGEGTGQIRRESEPLVGLLDALGRIDGAPRYQSRFGGSRRKARPNEFEVVIYDPTAATLLATCVGKAFKGDLAPVFFHFQLKKSGRAMNDLVVVGINLPEEGEDDPLRHDDAIQHIIRQFAELKKPPAGIDYSRRSEACIPADEEDLAILGVVGRDISLSTEDTSVRVSTIRKLVEQPDLALLDSNDYEESQYAENPPVAKRRHDFVIVSKLAGCAKYNFDKGKPRRGLGGEEVALCPADIRNDVATPDPWTYIRRGSDHLPVTMRVKLMRDTDGDLDPVECTAFERED
jgi:hypothetical protein